VKNERNSIIQFAERTRGKTFGSTFGDGFNNDLQAAAEQAKRETAMIEMVRNNNKFYLFTFFG
jgi:hypothetical protein